MGYGIRVLVEGKRACFTRPEMKAERVSYDVITPSAARGLLEAVYWKPAIRWHIDAIDVLNEIRFDTFRRNELKGKLNYRDAKAAMDRDEPLSYVVSEGDARQQRATLYLKHVAYIISAHFSLTSRAGEGDTPEKHYNIALRRLRKGQHFNKPVLGCREFPATVSLLEEGEAVPPSFYSDVEEKDLGFMLYDLDFSNPESPQPLFYRAIMRRGHIDVASLASGVVS